MDDFERKSDPEYQLRAIEKAYESTTSQLNHLESVLQKFSTNFQTQEVSLTNLYQKINQQQNIHTNIVKVRDYIVEIQNYLSCSERLKEVVQLGVENNFDAFMDAINEAIHAKKYLNRFQFTDAYEERTALQKIIENAKTEILTFFIKLACRSATPVPLSNFAFENGVFTIVEKAYENPIYPVTDEIIRMMRKMAEALDAIHATDQINQYCEARIKAMDDSIAPILEAAKTRVLAAQELNVLDLPYYKRKAHPAHTCGYLIGFFFKRELTFAKAVFGDKYVEPFQNSFNAYFNIFKSICVKCFQPVQCHTDILFDVDLVSTIVDVIESLVNDEDFQYFAVQLAQLSHMFHSGIEKVLQSYKTAIEHDDPDSIPHSGSVTALVSNTLYYLNTLAAYKKGVEQVGGICLDVYVDQVLQVLFRNTTEKSTHYTDVVLRQLFLMNNAHYAYTTIENWPALSTLVPQSFKEMLETSIQEAQKSYMNETWNKAFAILAYDKAFDNFKKGEQLNSTQKKIIKTKFKKFKEAVLEIQMKHNTYCLKNTKLMEPIMNEAISKTHSKFESFYMRWHDSGFARHPEKYTAVQPSTLEGIINRLYGPKKIHRKSTM